MATNELHLVGEALRLLRRARGIGQAELARQARMSRSQVSRYESGRTRPKLEQLARILEVLEVGFSDMAHALDMLRRLRTEIDPTFIDRDAGSLLPRSVHEGFENLQSALTGLRDRVRDRELSRALTAEESAREAPPPRPGEGA